MGEADNDRETEAADQRLAVVEPPPPVEEEDEELQRIRAQMEETRTRIATSLDDLQESFESTLDWKGWVRENPYKAVGIAFAAGFFFGLS